MLFSVLLSVYHKEDPSFLDQALHSIWDVQTLKPNQIVLVKDGPLTIELDAVVNSWQSKLIDVLTVVSLPQNQGLAAALNEGLKHCKHELVARMDTDDAALPDRFAKQIRAFSNNNDLDIIGGHAYLFSSELKKDNLRKSPITHDEVINHLWACPFMHPTVMFKKLSILKVGAYDTNLKRRQDYELWFRCASAGFKFANLPEPLIYYRFSEDTHSRQSIRNTWEQGVIGFSGSSAMKLPYWKRIACFVPFFRSLFPPKMQHAIYLALSRFDPKRS